MNFLFRCFSLLVSCLMNFLIFISTSYANYFDRFTLDPAFIQAIERLEEQGILDGEILIAQGDQVLFSAKSEECEACGSQDAQFMIGSLSKQFFAVALLKLLYDTCSEAQEEKKIEYVKQQLNQPLSTFLPKDHPIWEGQMPDWAQVMTPHHLLNHTSGLPNYVEMDRYTEIDNSNKKFFEIAHSRSEIIALISHEPLLFECGTEFSYSNTGYTLIAEMIETLSGLSTSDYLQQNLFQPLHLTSTYNPQDGQWPTLKQNEHCANLVSQWLYHPKKKQAKLYPPRCMIDVSNAIGSGSIISTTQDLLKWNLALHQQQILLPHALYQLMITPNAEGDGYGIGIETSNIGVVFGHQGSIDAYRSCLFYFPSYDLSIIYLTNTDYDWDKLEKEKNDLLNSLEEDDNEATATELLMQKYPDYRGYSRLMALIEEYFDIQEIE